VLSEHIFLFHMAVKSCINTKYNTPVLKMSATVNQRGTDYTQCITDNPDYIDELSDN